MAESPLDTKTVAELRFELWELFTDWHVLQRKSIMDRVDAIAVQARAEERAAIRAEIMEALKSPVYAMALRKALYAIDARGQSEKSELPPFDAESGR